MQKTMGMLTFPINCTCMLNFSVSENRSDNCVKSVWSPRCTVVAAVGGSRLSWTLPSLHSATESPEEYATYVTALPPLLVGHAKTIAVPAYKPGGSLSSTNQDKGAVRWFSIELPSPHPIPLLSPQSKPPSPEQGPRCCCLFSLWGAAHTVLPSGPRWRTVWKSGSWCGPKQARERPNH